MCVASMSIDILISKGYYSTAAVVYVCAERKSGVSGTFQSQLIFGEAYACRRGVLQTARAQFVAIVDAASKSVRWSVNWLLSSQTDAVSMYPYLVFKSLQNQAPYVDSRLRMFVVI